ncbi:MAG: flagellar biosynthesis anti-sigma factor FlgM [Bryobacteraceae bacterium]|jgi:flagellar biosynthesis anti-sigma factor FlgM|nr:flagellar biosynthesis anti-sigma factor FlgM [Bryobacteraceae bacterium]
MQINDSNLNRISTPYTGAAETLPGKAAARPERREGDGAGDGVQISDLGNLLNGLQSDSTVREQRIAELRELYLGGNYQVDSAKVAAAIVDDALLG